MPSFRRRALSGDDTTVQISGILEQLNNQGYEIGPARYKTVPRGYGDHKDNPLLKYDSLMLRVKPPYPTYPK